MTVTVHRVLGGWYFDGNLPTPAAEPLTVEVTHVVHVPDGSEVRLELFNRGVLRLPDGRQISPGVVVEVAEMRTIPDVYITSTIV